MILSVIIGIPIFVASQIRYLSISTVLKMHVNFKGRYRDHCKIETMKFE